MGRNLSNEAILTSAQEFTGTHLGYLDPPRQITLQVGYRLR